MRDRADQIVLVAALAIAVLAYAGTLTHQFVYEDAHLVETQAVTGAMLGDVVVAMAKGSPRSLTTATAWITSYGFGADPVAHHGLSVALHLLNGWLIYLVALTVLSPMGASVTAGLFWLHPLNTQAVNYVAARADLVTTACVLGMLALGLRGKWILAAGCAALAVLGKESGVVALPLWLWLAARTGKSTRLGWALVLLVPILGATVWTVLHYGELIDPMVMSRTPIGYALIQGFAALRTLGLFLVPIGQTVDFDYETVAAGWLGAALIGWIALGSVAWQARERAPWLLTSLGFFVIALGPRFLVRFSEYLNEHQIYLAVVGLCLGVGGLYDSIVARSAPRPA